MLTELVLVGNCKPSSLAIMVATWSPYHHLQFRTDRNTIIDSSFACGGVTEHQEAKHLGHRELVLRLLDHYTVAEVDIMTRRARQCIGRKYDAQGIVYGYIPNRPVDDWERKLWCFEFGRVVMEGFLPFDHRPDRAVGRHWIEAIKQVAEPLPRV